MKLAEMKIKDYLDVLKSDAPAPGGGSVSALTAAQGIGLVSMVCELTIGKERYKDFEKGCLKAREEAIRLLEELTDGIDKDTAAFTKVSAAYKMPKSTDEEKAVRSKAIAEATLTATEVPFEMLELCLQGLKVTEKLVGKSNPNASSDLGVAALNLLAGIKGAWLNVSINLPSVKDEEAKKKFAAGKEIVLEAETLALKIYQDVLDNL